MNPLGREYVFSAPLRHADQRAYLDKLYQLNAGADARVREHLDGILGRITDKSNGLLQVASIFSAVALFIAQQNAFKSILTLAGVLLLFVACFTLASNLGVSWRAKEHDHYDTRAASESIMRLLVGRIVRFKIAMWITIASVVVIGVEIFSLFVHPAGQTP